MGRVKQHWEEEISRGYYSTDKMICAKCMNEKYLSEVILENDEVGHCNYCKNETIVLPLESIMETIMDGIYSEYTNPENGVAWESSEGGWQGVEIIDKDELIQNILDLSDSKAIDDICDSIIEDEWCNIDLYSPSNQEEMRFAWSDFKEQIKHETRYVFLAENKPSSDDYRKFGQPHEILNLIGKNIEEFGFITYIPTDQIIFRARETNNGKPFSTSSELGAPPSEKAIYPNRMSPAGIAMFYGAFDKDTSIEEISETSSKQFTVAQWKPLRKLLVMDFTKLNKTPTGSYYYSNFPSIYDEINRWKRPYLAFLTEFTEELCSPIEKDGKEHIEYVPTQVVAEYFRRVFKTNSGDSIDGLVYYSAKGKGICIVLFCGQEGNTEIRFKEDQQIVKLVKIDPI